VLETSFPAVYANPPRRLRRPLYLSPDIVYGPFQLLAGIGNVYNCKDVSSSQFRNLGDLRILNAAFADWDAAWESELLLSDHLKQFVVFFRNKQARL
jgi:hypothetical protein